MSLGETILNPAQRTAHLDELVRLDAEILQTTDVYALKPIHERLEELAGLYAADAAMLNSIAALRAKMVSHGQQLMSASGMQVPPPPAPTPASMLPTQVMPATGSQPPPAQALNPQFSQPQVKPAPPAAFNWKRAAAVGGVVGLLVAAAGIYTIRNSRKGPEDEKPSANVKIAVKTNPPGASIRINGEVKCASDCNIELAPGQYEVQAVLPGYEPGSSKIDVSATAPTTVDLTLVPLPLSVRLYTDYKAGKVTFDNAPYGELLDGQLILDRIAAGKHTIKVSSGTSEAQFEFETQPGRQPVISASVTARNTLAIIVANAGQSARVHSSIPTLKVSVDGSAVGDATASGLEINNLQTGDREFAVDDGTGKRNLVVSVSAQPTLTAYLKTDSDIGSLLIATPGEDDVMAFMNDRSVLRKSKNGQMRITGIPAGNYVTRVAKDGYTADPPKTITIVKGQEARLEFKLKAIPRFAGLRLRGAAPGTQIYLDGSALGAVPASGAFEFAQITPGEHVLELRRDRMANKRIPRQFRAGETVELSGADVTLIAAGGAIKLTVTPASAIVTIKGPADTAPRPVSASTLQLAEGTYVFSAKAPNHADKSQTVTLANGENKNVDMVLTEQKLSTKKDSAPARRIGGMPDWDEPAAFSAEGGWYQRKGGGLVTYGLTPTQGVFTFNISRIEGKRIGWTVDVQDPRNYVLFQMDRKTFYQREFLNGKGSKERKLEHKLPDTKNYIVSIEITPNTVKTFVMDGAEWRLLDSWSTNSRTLTQGKFGLFIPSNDVFGLNNFKFVPK